MSWLNVVVLSVRYDFISVPIAHPRHKRDLTGGSLRRFASFTRTDMILNSTGLYLSLFRASVTLKYSFISSADWSTYIVGKISPYIDVDHEDKAMRQQSEMILDQELSFAGHLGLPAVMMSLKKNNVNLARTLHNKVVPSSMCQV